MENILEGFSKHSYEDWKAVVVKSLKGADFEKSLFTQNYENIKLDPIYNLSDISELSTVKGSYPGIYPFSRHPQVSGYFVNEWEIAQNIPYSLPHIFNQALKNDILMGQNSIKISIDKAVLFYEDYEATDLSNYDLIINDIEDIRNTLDGIDLYQYPIHIYSGFATLPSFACFIAYFKALNYNISKLSGSFNFDIFSDLLIEGQLNIKIDSLLDQVAMIIRWTNEFAPQFRVINIDTSVIHNSGGNNIQEIAYSLSYAIFIINSLLDRGLNIEQIANSISFNFSIGTNFFMEIAKLRAFRISYSKILSTYGLDTQKINIFLKTETSQRDSTYYDAYNNLLRSTSETFASIIGGTNYHTVRNFDELHRLPNEFSRRTARNIQIVLKYEAHLLDTIDPAGGSYYIEKLSSDLAQSSWSAFQKLEANGGIVEVLKHGDFQDTIYKINQDRIKNLAIRKDIKVGTNKYPNLNEDKIDNNIDFNSKQIDDFIEQYDKRLLGRNLDVIDSILDDFEANYNYNDYKQIDKLINSFVAGATIAEVFNSIPNEAEATIVKPLSIKRTSEDFEILRMSNENYKQEGKLNKIMLVCIGELKDYKARLEFISDFLSVGGFEFTIFQDIIYSSEFSNRFAHKDKNVFLICSSDNLYTQFVPELAKDLKHKSVDNFLILAGLPKEQIAEYNACGIDNYIHIKSNLIEELTGLQTRLINL
ncbi:MAG TPA: methylmalonyl-CoA mutase family protein [Candidatus Kapabacteria bacterium]|nr:methylmalonyl-CoA mutase family protein [Candidatus Kapabacteria bacterium]